MTLCEAPWAQPCGSVADGPTLFAGETLLTCTPCRHDLGDFELFHKERATLTGPKAAFESWRGQL